MPKKKTKPFSRMSVNQQRVVLAKDSLGQMRVGRFLAQSGNYVSNRIGTDNETADQKFFTGKVAPCNVCAKGALICSIIRKENEFSGSIEALSENVEKVLRRFFGKRQGDLIEAAFEGWGTEYTGTAKTIAFYERFQDSDKLRLKEILKNIIKNNGTFKP